MSIKKFLLSGIILNIFFLSFSGNIFGYNQYCLHDEKYFKGICFAKNFYSDIYDKTDFKKKSFEKISKETGLSEKFLIDFQSGSGSITIECINQNLTAIKKCENHCKTINKISNSDNNCDECKNKKISQFCESVSRIKNSAYYEDLLHKKINFEIKLIKLKQNLQSIGENEDIFTDGDYKNSFFDIVTQWNIIDVILFGKEGKTPFFKYKKSNDDKDENQNNNKNDDEENNPDELLNNKNSENEKIITYFGENTSSESKNLNNSTKNGFSNSKIFKDKNGKIITDICIDPFLVENSINNEKIFSKSEKKSSIIEKILQNQNNSGKNISDKISENAGGDNLYEISENGFIQPVEKKDDGEKCKKPLYGGYICLDGNKWKCFPIGKAEEGSEMGENGQYCRNINMIYQNQDVFGNIGDASSIDYFIKKSLKTIEDKIEGQAIYPMKNSLNQGNNPHLKGLNRIMSFLEISKKPMPWEKENYKKNETINIDYEDLFTPMSNIFTSKNIIETISDKNKNSSKIYQKANVSKIKNKEKAAVIKDAYHGDVNGRITEFRDLFKNGILNNIKSMPFDTIKRISKKTCSNTDD